MPLPLPEKKEDRENPSTSELHNSAFPIPHSTFQRVISLKETLIGADIKGIEGKEKAKTIANYFTGNVPSKWKNNITTYNTVSLGEIYKGIELRLKAYGNNVEKLFYVQPDANPDNISLALNGGKSIKVNEQGELEIETELGIVKFTKPIAYQEMDGKRVEVEVSYQIADFGMQNAESGEKEVSLNPQSISVTPHLAYAFKLGNYDKTKELVIDPLLASTFIGGSYYDEYPYALGIDSSGNVFVAGKTYSTDYPITSGAYDTSHNGSWDVFVSKLNNTLTTLSASTFIGGSNIDYANALVIDSSGNVFVAGRTGSSDFPITSGVYDTSQNGGYDVFVSKFDSNLSTTTYTLTANKSGTGSGTVTSNPSGINCGIDCSETYSSGTSVTLTATSDSGSTFTGWSDGGCSGTGTCTMVVNADTSVTATFNSTSSGGGTTGNSGSSGGSGGGCFIATAAYGSYLDPHVMVLRNFRDNYLMTNAAGRMFVSSYYKYSTSVADFIAKHETLRIATRWTLTPIVYCLEYPLITVVFIFLATGLMVSRSRNRKKKQFICPECHNKLVETYDGGVFKKSNKQQIEKNGNKYFIKCSGKNMDNSYCNHKMRIIPKGGDEYIIADCIYASENVYANESWHCLYCNSFQNCSVLDGKPCVIKNGPFQAREHPRYGVHEENSGS